MLDFKFTDSLVSNGIPTGTVPIISMLQEKSKIKVTNDDTFFLRTPLVSKVSDNTNIDVGFAGIEENSILLGPTNRNVSVTGLPENKVIFDYITKKPFSDYEVSTLNSSTIYLAATHFSNKTILVWSDNQGNKTILEPTARYPYTVNEDGSISCPSYAESLLTFIKNPLTRFSCYVPQKNKYSTWKPRFRVCQELIEGKALTIPGGKSRHSVISDEQATLLKDNLIQLEEVDIINTSWGTSLPIGYFNSEFIDGSSANILFNKEGIVIESFNFARGILLLKNPAPSQLLVLYKLNNAHWKEIDVDLNPLSGANFSYLGIEINTETGKVHYRKDTEAFLHSSETNHVIISNLLNASTYIKSSHLLPETKEISLIDIRRPGGMLDRDNIETSSYNLDSHTNYGFMGVNPTQLNLIAVHLPDSVLETIIIQFSDHTPTWDWSIDRMTYINFIRTTLWKTETEWAIEPLNSDDLLNKNPMKTEILQNITRHLSAGILAVVYDTNNNLIFISNR